MFIFQKQNTTLCGWCTPHTDTLPQSRSQYVHHFCDGVTTLINHISITTMSTLMKVGAINWALGAANPKVMHV